MVTGDKIPEVLGLNTEGREIKAADFAGKPLIIYFYPKDNTPGCTAEACSIRDGYGELKALGYEIIGISKDSVASHVKFADKYSLPFILLSDPDTTVNQAFGVWHADHHVTHIITKVDTKNATEQLLKLLAR